MNYSFLVLSQICLDLRVNKPSPTLLRAIHNFLPLNPSSQSIRWVLHLYPVFPIQTQASIKRLKKHSMTDGNTYHIDALGWIYRRENYIGHFKRGNQWDWLIHRGASLQTGRLEKGFKLFLGHIRWKLGQHQLKVLVRNGLPYLTQRILKQSVLNRFRPVIGIEFHNLSGKLVAGNIDRQ